MGVGFLENFFAASGSGRSCDDGLEVDTWMVGQSFGDIGGVVLKRAGKYEWELFHGSPVDDVFWIADFLHAFFCFKIER